MVGHILEYSKSSKAKCHGPSPCNGTPIDLGVLRYGEVSKGLYGETVQWRHWGCVTTGILRQFAHLQLPLVPGYKRLRHEDQEKVRAAVIRGQVDPADIPESAKTAPLNAPPLTHAVASTSAAPSGSQKKRKVPWDAPQSQVSGLPSQPSLAGQSRVSYTRGMEFEDDEDEDVDEGGVDELYCTMTTNVVGIQYYSGLVGAGEEVLLVREPHNKYDRNAVQVKNIARIQVGHLPRAVVTKLAPLLDQNLVTVEGRIHEGNMNGRNQYSLSMTLQIYAASDWRKELEPRLIWATPGQRGFPPRSASGAPSASQARPGMPASQAHTMPSATQLQRAGMNAEQVRRHQEQIAAQQEALMKAAELKQMLNNLEKVDDEGRRSSLLDTLCFTEDVLDLPLHPSPPGIQSGELVVDLLKHQSQALQWCVQHENPVLPAKETDKPVQFWQYKMNGNKAYYFNLATKTPQEAKPTLGRGAICADSMGLGKTLTMLSLILATKSDVPLEYSNSTLIVVPLSILSNWEAQIKEHCAPGILTYHIYYDKGRSVNQATLKKYDVIITTYQVVSKEHSDEGFGNDMLDGLAKKRRKSANGLFGVEWKRVVLDEGHTIRNPKTKMAKAVCALSAERRWVVTGTPIINSPKDLGSMLTFLQVCRPLDDDNFYKRLLLRPLKDGDPTGAELLRGLMNQICIRRTKEMQDSQGNHLVPLPPVEMTIIPVQLEPEARELYDTVEDISKQRVANYINSHGGTTVPANVLSMLTRLRQIALHPGLVPARYLEELRSQVADDESTRPAIEITPDTRTRLQGLLVQAIEDNEECPICFSVFSDPRITSCSHIYCLECISAVLVHDTRCPMDRRTISMGDLIEPPAPTELTQAHVRQEEEDTNDSLRNGSSAKIDQLVHLLKLTPSNEKSLVFSQFTSFHDKIAETLEAEGVSFIRFDGSMSARRRQETLERFCVPLDEESSATQSDTRLQRRSASAVDYSAGDADNDTFIDDDDYNDSYLVNSKKSKGKGKAKVKSNTAFDQLMSSGENPKVMLISLKAGALGLNLTVANNVYLMDPWWQEGIESQAIDRCNRIGQKKTVHVYQLIAENTVESKVIDIQEKKKKLVQQAFSGMKSAETPRQKKEARLQDLIELFGVRQQASSQTQTQRTLDSFGVGIGNT